MTPKANRISLIFVLWCVRHWRSALWLAAECRFLMCRSSSWSFGCLHPFIINDRAQWHQTTQTHSEPKPAPDDGSKCSGCGQWWCERRRQDEEKSSHHYRHNRSGNVKYHLNIYDAIVCSPRNQKSVIFTHLCAVSNAYDFLYYVENKAKWQHQSPFSLREAKMTWIVTEAVKP